MEEVDNHEDIVSSNVVLLSFIEFIQVDVTFVVNACVCIFPIIYFFHLILPANIPNFLKLPPTIPPLLNLPLTDIPHNAMPNIANMKCNSLQYNNNTKQPFNNIDNRWNMIIKSQAN